MNTYLLNLISKWLGIVFISFISLFNFGYEKKHSVIDNDIINNNSYMDADIIEYKTEYIYDSSLPNTHEEIIVEGKNGVSYEQDGEIVVVSEPINEVIEVGTGPQGVYTGMLTGYGPDCYGCSGQGNVNCYTRERTTHSLVTDGIYYEDTEYGSVRILAADHRQFPCGTIIEITNSNLDKELGVVLDTGSGMRNAYNNGWILIDLAFEKESLTSSVTNKNTTFVVKRWGW